jgi:hypothetical protein
MESNRVVFQHGIMKECTTDGTSVLVSVTTCISHSAEDVSKPHTLSPMHGISQRWEVRGIHCWDLSEVSSADCIQRLRISRVFLLRGCTCKAELMASPVANNSGLYDKHKPEP